MRLIPWLALGAHLLGLTPSAGAQQRRADLILTDGKIFTSDFTRPYVQAIAIRGDRVLAIGSTAEMRGLAGPETREIPLAGRTVIPGINDAHVHAGPPPAGHEIAFRSPDPSWRNIVDSVRAVARRLPEGTMVRATAGASAFFDRAATRAALDRVAPRHPVLVTAFTGHGLLMNTAALGALGVTDSTIDPVGGWLARDSSGALTGFAFGYAQWRLDGLDTPEASDSSAMAAYRALSDQAVRFGITTVQVMPLRQTATEVARVVAASEPLIRWRVITMAIPGAPPRRVAQRPPRSPLVTLSGVKWILDGTTVERNALLRSEYADKPGWVGQPYIAPDALRRIVGDAFSSRDQLLLHAVGDSTIALVLDAMAAAGTFERWQPKRLRLEHAAFFAPDQLLPAKRFGVVVVQNPSHLMHPEIMRVRVPRHVLPTFQPLKTLMRQGVPLALGSDGPLNPFLNIMFAATHSTNPSEALTIEQAIVAYTRGSAYAEGMDERKGTLMPGMLADLAVLSQDIFRVKLEELPRTESVMTIVGGKVIFEK